MQTEKYESAVRKDAKAFAAYLLKTHKLRVSAAVLYWYEAYNAFRAEGVEGDVRPHFLRESDIRDHFNRLAPHVVRILRASGLLVIKISNKYTLEHHVAEGLIGTVMNAGMSIVRKYRQNGEGIAVVREQGETRRRLKHGSIPIEDDTRNEAFYRSILAGSPDRAAFGFLVFPASSQPGDHPALRESIGRKGRTARTTIESFHGELNHACDLNLISTTVRNEILKVCVPIAREITSQAKGLPA